MAKENKILIISKEEMTTKKKQWGKAVVEAPIEIGASSSPATDGEYTAYVLIAMRNQDVQPMYKKIVLRAPGFAEAEAAFVKKIEEDRKRFPLFLFLY